LTRRPILLRVHFVVSLFTSALRALWRSRERLLMLLSDLQISLFAARPIVATPHRPFFQSAAQPTRNPDKVAPGTCQFCGCHGDSCSTRTGDTCGWTDSTRTCCTADCCVSQLNKPDTKPQPSPQPSWPCPCAVCSGRARGRCRQKFYR
jgi:hypothetical protein